jgi:hypothetical protein
MFHHRTSHQPQKIPLFFNSAESRQGNICMSTCELQCRHVIFDIIQPPNPPPAQAPNLHKYAIPILLKKNVTHRVYVQSASFSSSRPNWVLPTPHPQASVAPPTFGSKGGETFAMGERGPNSDKGTDILVLIFILQYLYDVTRPVSCSFSAVSSSVSNFLGGGGVWRDFQMACSSQMRETMAWWSIFPRSLNHSLCLHPFHKQ